MNSRCFLLFLLVGYFCKVFVSNKIESNPPTHTSSFDTFHGARDHKKKKNIHMKGSSKVKLPKGKVAHKVKTCLEEKKKEMDVPMMVESQGCKVDSRLV